MADAYEHVRKDPLKVVLAALGFDTFKYRKAGTEGFGACPIHSSKEEYDLFLVRRQRPMTAPGHSWCELAPHFRIFDGLEVAQAGFLGRAQHGGIGKCDDTLDPAPDLPTILARRHRVVAEVLELFGRVNDEDRRHRPFLA